MCPDLWCTGSLYPPNCVSCIWKMSVVAGSGVLGMIYSQETSFKVSLLLLSKGHSWKRFNLIFLLSGRVEIWLNKPWIWAVESFIRLKKINKNTLPFMLPSPHILKLDSNGNSSYFPLVACDCGGSPDCSRFWVSHCSSSIWYVLDCEDIQSLHFAGMYISHELYANVASLVEILQDVITLFYLLV